MHERRIDCKIKKDYIANIPKYKKLKNDDIFAPHAIVFTCLDDLELILQDENKCVEVQLFVKHGLTGLGKVFKYEYSTMEEVKDRPFNFGNNLTIS
jgi:hypothetical protein